MQGTTERRRCESVHCFANAPYGCLPLETTTARFLLFCFSASLSGFSQPEPSGHTPRPVSRPSAGVVEGVERQGCRESREGHGWPFVACPWSGTGARGPRRSRGRMQGSPSLWLLSLGETRESDAPCRAQPVVRAEESAAFERPDREAKRQKLRPQAGSYSSSKASAPCRVQPASGPRNADRSSPNQNPKSKKQKAHRSGLFSTESISDTPRTTPPRPSRRPRTWSRHRSVGCGAAVRGLGGRRCVSRSCRTGGRSRSSRR